MDEHIIWISEIGVTAVIVILALALRRYVSKKRITVKQITFVGIMSAMGTALAIVSFVPLGPNINVDFSHIGTFIVAIALGPFYGMIAGGLIAIYPMTVFGNPLFPPGKALTGLVVGLLANRLRLAMNNPERKLPLIVPTVVVGWIPEAVFILVTLAILGIPYMLPLAVVEGILVKGTVEVLLLGILCQFLFSSKALRQKLESLRESTSDTTQIYD